MIDRQRLRTAPWLVSMLIACGPKTDAVESDSGSNSGSGPTSAGSTTSVTCDDLQPAGSTAVLFSVRNDRADPIYLDLTGCGPAVQLFGPDGTPAAWRLPSCDVPSCEDLLAGDCAVACADCAPGVIRIGSGAVYTADWPGTLFVDAGAPAECTAVTCDSPCSREVAAPPDRYSLHTAFFDTCPFSDPASCECPTGNDQCALFNVDDTPTGVPIVAEAGFDYDAETDVELAIP